MIESAAALSPSMGLWFHGLPVPMWALSVFLTLAIIMAASLWIARRRDTPDSYAAAFKVSVGVFVVQTATTLVALP